MASAAAHKLSVEFVGIRLLYKHEFDRARFCVTLPPAAQKLKFSATHLQNWRGIPFVRRRLTDIVVVSDELVAEGTRKLEVSVPVRAYEPGLIFKVSARLGSRPLRARLRLSSDDLFAANASWQEERRNVQNFDGYDAWFTRFGRTGAAEIDAQRTRAAQLSLRPLISAICPVYKTKPEHLRQMIGSVLDQSYDNFELLMLNASPDDGEVLDVLATTHDPRVRVLEIENRSIAENTNEGIRAARGDYLCFIDHDDFIEPDTFFRYVSEINEHPQLDLLFCDEDMWGIDEGADQGQKEHFFGPKFKPGWNPDRLLDGNIVCHMLMVSRAALDQVALSDASLTGAQDYDLTFKVAECARAIAHVPYMLYHWRSHAASSATNLTSKPYLFEAGRRAITAHLERSGIPAQVGEGSYPLTYKTTLRTTVPEARVMQLPLEDLVKPSFIQTLPPEAAYLLFVADGCSLEEGCAQALLERLQFADIGVAAPLVCDEDGVVASAGLTLCRDGSRTPMSRGLTPFDTGYSQYLCCAHDCAAVAPACIALRRDVLEELGGPEPGLSLPAAVVDVCLKVQAAGLFVCLLPWARVRAHNANVGLNSDAAQLVALHPHIAAGDPYLGACLDETSPYYRLAAQAADNSG